MRPIVLTQNATGAGTQVPVDYFQNPPNIGVATKLSTGAVEYTIEYTLDDPFTASDSTGAGLTWLQHPMATSLAYGAYTQINIPVRAIRINVAAISGGGVLTSTIVQNGAGVG